MSKRPWPSELDRYSSLIGQNILLVQGPGGNTSFKDEKTMWVKGSGTRLADADQEEIFAGVNRADGELIESSNGLRPSIEKDFHLLVPYPYVIHTHSLRAISMAISNNFGEDQDLFPDIAFVPYARPGKDLCELIKSILDYDRHKCAVLQNHGFLTWGLRMEEAYNYLLDFESQEDFTEFNFQENESLIEHPRAITPDYAVFLSQMDESDILRLDGSNIWKKQMYQVAQSAAGKIGKKSKINYLPEQEVHGLQNWESEKFRIAANK
jgi:hypothetical protein